MRTIKFRAKLNEHGRSKDNLSEWQYFTLADLAVYGEEFWKLIDPKTVGEFTGLHDKNGREIWEGDIVNGLHCPKRLVVVWDDGCCAFMLRDKVEDYEYAEHLFNTTGEDDYGMNMWEVIGNIYEGEVKHEL